MPPCERKRGAPTPKGNAPRSTQQWAALIMKAYTNTEGIQLGWWAIRFRRIRGKLMTKGLFMMSLMSKSQKNRNRRNGDTWSTGRTSV